MKSYASHLVILQSIRDVMSADLMRRHQLRCSACDWMDSAVLKLQKDTWTSEGTGQGIFFSVWLGEKDLQAGRFNYNIHALKTGDLPGHAVKPREFATAFREKFEASGAKSNWPNLSTDYGRQTLMQGWMPLDEVTFQQDVEALIGRFVKVHQVIDALLLERQKRA
ncbi:hypothetical protein DES53_102947 [Roseimicrobium gellanilyticum]|uniref:DUF4268 domain-containing protein n=1 Tax=Roseimicrobium gellanilyticum TaxID=748857 RepID=A0A366HSS9_9BACT|nr:hypothetical protein [Roseimicrobium gellanilyticum]RBP46556.1 hypothetical protein DES53_102947 [Roseimicrobium gellanilyticum]